MIFFIYIIYFHPKGEVKRLRENGFSGGCTGRVWGVGGNGNRALRKEPSREQQRKPGLPESVNGSSGKESHGHEHDTEQNTECRQQLEGMHYIFEWRQIIACSIPSRAEREAASYVLFLWREEGSISTFEWWFHQSLLKKLYVGSCSQDKYILQYIIFYFQQKTMPY